MAIDSTSTTGSTPGITQSNSSSSLSNLSSNLDNFLKILTTQLQQETNIMVGAVSYIGKEVEATGQTTTLEDGKAKFIYSLPEEATASILAIYDENGTQVLFKQADKEAGRHEFIWDGKDTKGATMPDGDYTIQVVAVNADNEAITPAYSITGTVTGVGIDDGEATLSLGGMNVPLANVVRVIEQDGDPG